MGFDRVHGVDGGVSYSCINCLVPADDLGDLQWYPGRDCVGDGSFGRRGAGGQWLAGRVDQPAGGECVDAQFADVLGRQGRCSSPIARWSSSDFGGFRDPSRMS